MKPRLLLLALLIQSAVAITVSAKTSVLLLAGRYDSKPVVSVIAPAEVLVCEVAINSLADEAEDRLREIQNARNALREAATKNGWSVKADQVVISGEDNRKFRSFVSSNGELNGSSSPLLLVPLAENSDSVSLVRRVRQLTEKLSVPKKLQLICRDFRVGVENPEKFRAELLRKTREHIDLTAGALGEGISLQISGLDEPIAAQQIEEHVIELSLPLRVTYTRAAK